MRLRDYRFRVIGVLEGRGDSFGMDLSEAIFIPVPRRSRCSTPTACSAWCSRRASGWRSNRLKHELIARMKELHEGEEDVTVISPDAMLSTFDGMLRALTLGVSGIAAISLVVAGILVMNLTLMSVSQRTAEIGLLKALGATDAQVRAMFLAEAGVLAAAGALAGMLAGRAASRADRGALPRHPLPLAALGAVAAARGARDRAAVRVAARREGRAARTRARARQALRRCTRSTGPAGYCAR